MAAVIARRTVTARVAPAVAAAAGARAKHTLPQLPYEYSALEPAISGQIMELHHTKHHQAYVTNYNTAEEKLQEALAKNDVAAAIALQGALKFNGGGHVNHSIFWTNLAPKKQGGGSPPTGPLADAIVAQFGSLQNFVTKFNAQAAGVQGSGWGWLGYDKDNKRLVIATTANQDPLVVNGLVPLLGVDVWEHAYYLQYKNVRVDYLKAVWEVVNWANVAERYANAQK
eukprot:Unigene2275_Nuclearia_a/m.7057 Unigene2275_Nuclearia_a/g.7057  ORF Unigene2275_Nuclearia_a/g.7057 Unigene2275_Nuclearia_a/m.7057 type:complete len:227 (+) Unigene2275_Nuclearia_a:37-717(+)